MSEMEPYDGDDGGDDGDDDAGEIERKPLPPEEFVAPRLDYLATEVYPRASEIWREMGTGYVFVGARFHIPEVQATRAALGLYHIDRETRRALKIMAGRGRFDLPPDEDRLVYEVVERAKAATPRRLLRPTSVQSGGFELLRAEPGSADFFLDALRAAISRSSRRPRSACSNSQLDLRLADAGRHSAHRETQAAARRA